MEHKLPKEYLSWSQMNLWETSPQKYIDTYIYGKEFFETKEMRFGKWVAAKIETGQRVDPKVDHLLQMLYKRRYKENEIVVDFEGIQLKAGFDSIDKYGFDEYKTGKVLWDATRANKHGQLDFYALCFKLEMGYLPDIALHWLPTVGEGKERIDLVGEIHTFIVEKNEEQLFAFGERIKKVVDEISHYKKFEKKVVEL